MLGGRRSVPAERVRGDVHPSSGLRMHIAPKMKRTPLWLEGKAWRRSTIRLSRAKGRRTVTSALRAVGHTQMADWAKYHHVLDAPAGQGCTE